MPRKKPAIIKATTNKRPKQLKRNQLILIDWEQVDKLIKLDYNGGEIAKKYNIHYDTLAGKFKKEFNLLLSEHIRKLPETVVAEWNEQNKAGKTTFDELDMMMQAGCVGTELAAYFGVGQDFIRKVMEQRYRMTLSEVRKNQKTKGDAMLKMKQFQGAMKGDKHLLTVLGKDRLSQTEKQEINLNVKARVLSADEAAEIFKKLNNDY